MSNTTLERRSLVQQLRPGDVVEMSTERLPALSKFKAAIESVEGGEFSVFSVDLAQYSLLPGELTFKVNGTDFSIIARTDAEIAVPNEANGFKVGDRLRTTVPDTEGYYLIGNVVAAIDGLVYLRTSENEPFSAEVKFLEFLEPAN